MVIVSPTKRLIMAGALLACLTLAACTTPSGTFCDIASPIRLSDTAIDAMSDEEVTAALAHNERGKRLCQWRPRG